MFYVSGKVDRQNISGYGEQKPHVSVEQKHDNPSLMHGLIEKKTFCQVPSVTWLDHSQLFLMQLHQGSSVSAPHHKLLTNRKWELLPRLRWDRWDIVCITQGHHTEHLWNRQMHQEKMSNIIHYVSHSLTHFGVYFFFIGGVGLSP
jgi:hypothetical protein